MISRGACCSFVAQSGLAVFAQLLPMQQETAPAELLACAAFLFGSLLAYYVQQACFL